MKFSIEPGTIDIWQISLQQNIDDLHTLTSLLDSHERQRYQRYHPSKKTAYLISHAACRQILQYYTGLAPAEILYQFNEHGKPALHPAIAKTDLRFNMSHSDQMALLAITESNDIGIDIEHCSDRPAWPRLAKRFYSSAETDYLFSQPEHAQVENFFRIWTHKEAYIKAIGTGLATPLPSFSVIHNNEFGERCYDLSAESPLASCFQSEIKTHSDYKAALVSQKIIKKIQYFDYETLIDAKPATT